jgi:hypothetical protein
MNLSRGKPPPSGRPRRYAAAAIFPTRRFACGGKGEAAFIRPKNQKSRETREQEPWREWLVATAGALHYVGAMGNRGKRFSSDLRIGAPSRQTVHSRTGPNLEPPTRKMLRIFRPPRKWEVGSVSHGLMNRVPGCRSEGSAVAGRGNGNIAFAAWLLFRSGEILSAVGHANSQDRRHHGCRNHSDRSRSPEPGKL